MGSKMSRLNSLFVLDEIYCIPSKEKTYIVRLLSKNTETAKMEILPYVRYTTEDDLMGKEISREISSEGQPERYRNYSIEWLNKNLDRLGGHVSEKQHHAAIVPRVKGTRCDCHDIHDWYACTILWVEPKKMFVFSEVDRRIFILSPYTNDIAPVGTYTKPDGKRQGSIPGPQNPSIHVHIGPTSAIRENTVKLLLPTVICDICMERVKCCRFNCEHTSCLECIKILKGVCHICRTPINSIINFKL